MTTKNTKEIINKTEFYHSVEINDYKIKGFYNWEPYIDLITNLIDFNKKKVLDVGPGDGYFSQKFSSLGSKVEAVDIPSQEERDNYKFGKKNKHIHSTGGKKRKHNFNFHIFNKIHKNNIKLHNLNVYELEKLKKTYDLVFCNDLLLHLTDPIRAINQMTLVSKDYILIGNPILNRTFFNKNKSQVDYLGHLKNNAYYIFNENAFINLINSFNLKIIKKIIVYPKKEHFYSTRPRMFILAKKY